MFDLWLLKRNKNLPRSICSCQENRKFLKISLKKLKVFENLPGKIEILLTRIHDSPDFKPDSRRCTYVIYIYLCVYVCVCIGRRVCVGLGVWVCVCSEQLRMMNTLTCLPFLRRPLWKSLTHIFTKHKFRSLNRRNARNEANSKQCSTRAALFIGNTEVPFSLPILRPRLTYHAPMDTV